MLLEWRLQVAIKGLHGPLKHSQRHLTRLVFTLPNLVLSACPSLSRLSRPLARNAYNERQFILVTRAEYFTLNPLVEHVDRGVRLGRHQ